MPSFHRDESSSELHLPQISLGSQAALRDPNLLDGRSDSTQLHGLTAGELVHGCFGHIEAAGSGVDGQYVDRLALIRKGEALSALSAVPAGDGRGAADSGEAGYRAEGLVAVPRAISTR